MKRDCGNILKLAQQWKKTADKLDQTRYGCNQRVADVEVDTLRYCAKELEDLFFQWKGEGNESIT